MIFRLLRKTMEGYSLRKIDQSLRETDLPEHLVSRHCALSGRIEENVGLLFGILVILSYGSYWLQCRVVYRQVEKSWRESAHHSLEDSVEDDVDKIYYPSALQRFSHKHSSKSKIYLRHFIGTGSCPRRWKSAEPERPYPSDDGYVLYYSF